MSIDIKLCELSRPLRAVMFFTVHPDAALTTNEMAELLEWEPHRVRKYLQGVRVNGLIECEGARKVNGAWVQNVYRAGPALLRVRAAVEKANG